MNKLTAQLIKDHTVDLYELNMLYEKDAILMFKEYDEGFLMVIKGLEYNILFSAAVDNKYGYRMWKDLITFIDKRDRPIMVSFGANQERLFKASERYTFETLSDNVILIK